MRVILSVCCNVELLICIVVFEQCDNLLPGIFQQSGHRVQHNGWDLCMARMGKCRTENSPIQYEVLISCAPLPIQFPFSSLRALFPRPASVTYRGGALDLLSDRNPIRLVLLTSVVCLFSIVALENLVLWWDSMSSVEKATRESVTQLISMGEAIINSERGSWLSTPGRGDDKDGKGNKPTGEVGKEGKSE